MELIIIIALIIVVLTLIFIIYRGNSGGNSDLIIQLSNNLSNQIKAGVHGIILGGTLGEASTLKDLEKKESMLKLRQKISLFWMNLKD